MSFISFIDRFQKYPIRPAIKIIDDNTIEYSLSIWNGSVCFKKKHEPNHCAIRLMDKLFIEMPQSIGKCAILLYLEPKQGILGCAGAFSLTGNRTGDSLLSGQKLIFFFPSKFNNMYWSENGTNKNLEFTPHHFTFEGKKGGIKYHVTSATKHEGITGSLKETDLGIQLGHLFVSDFNQMDCTGKFYSRYIHDKKISRHEERLQSILKKSLANKQRWLRVPEEYFYNDGGIMFSFHLSDGNNMARANFRKLNSLVNNNGIILKYPHLFNDYPYYLGDNQLLRISVTRFEGKMDTNFLWYSEPS